MASYKPIRVSGSAGPALRRQGVGQFLGVNLTDAPSNMGTAFSPNAPNMIRDTPGKIRKWMGWFNREKYPAAIHGAHFWRDGGSEKRLIHAGDQLYEAEQLLYTGMSSQRSAALQMGKRLYILDGQQLLAYDGQRVTPAAEAAFVPTVVVASAPTGGGTPLQPVNLLTPKRRQTMLGDEQAKCYQLAANNLDAAPVTVKKTTASGAEQTLLEGSDFTVNRSLGQITFVTAHPPVTAGIPHLTADYSVTVQGYAQRVNRCGIGVLFGHNGGRDRLFISGNPDYPNLDWHSALNDPTYFGDTWYSQLGQQDSAVMGYSVINDQLAAHKSESADGTSIYLRRGALLKDEVVFPLAGAYQGAGAVSRYAFGVLATEPMFLSSEGVFAVTRSDVLGERYAQNRSYYLNGALLAEPARSEGVAVVYNGFYLLALNTRLYALDSLQITNERSTPYSTRQYTAFVRDNVEARVLWVEQGALWFGTSEGQLRQFYTDPSDLRSYNDEGAPIPASWQTPDFHGSAFEDRKTFRQISVLLGAAAATGCRIWAIYDGIRELIVDYDGSARYFSFEAFSFKKCTFSTDRTPHWIRERLYNLRPNSRKISFVFENDQTNEPFSLFESGLKFRESRN